MGCKVICPQPACADTYHFQLPVLLQQHYLLEIMPAAISPRDAACEGYLELQHDMCLCTCSTCFCMDNSFQSADLQSLERSLACWALLHDQCVIL